MIIGGGCVRPSTIITGQVWPSRCIAWARRDIAALWMSRPSPSAGGGIPVLLVLAAMIITCVGAGGARISPEDYWRPCGRGACGSSVWTVVHAMTCRPHPSVYDRPTDRYTLAALALCGGSPCGSLSPSLNRYIPPPARGGKIEKISKTPKKIRDVHKNTPPGNQMTNERRVWPGGARKRGQKAAGKTISPQQ